MRDCKCKKGKHKAIPVHAMNMQIRSKSTRACPLILKPNIKW